MAKSRNILFIVEGESDEPNFLNHLFQICFPESGFKYWSYRTSLHDLVCDLYPDGEFDPDVDILLHLRSKAHTEEEKEILSESMCYTDIFMIFDFEPHYRKESAVIQLDKYTYPVWMAVCGHHLMKLEYILHSKYELPDAEEYLEFRQDQLFDVECKKHKEQRMVDVINTAIFLLMEYEPVRVLEDMKRHKERYYL